MANKVKPIPEGYHTVTPYLVICGAAKAIDFYQRAFGAKVQKRLDMPDGKVMHATIKIGDSIIMLSDEFPRSKECGMSSPTTIKGSTVSIHLYVEDSDAAFDEAVKAGAKVQMPIADTFWGDRYGQVVDPFGHLWSISTQKESLTDEEIQKRAAEFFSHQG